MAYEYIALDQTVALNSPILFTDSITRQNGDVYHNNGSGIFTLNGRNIRCNCNNASAQYQVTFVANIGIPDGGTAGPIALALLVDGEIEPSTRAISTPAAVEEYNSVSISKIIRVPRICGCQNISIEYVSGLVDDPTGTPAPLITVLNGNLIINRIA